MLRCDSPSLSVQNTSSPVIVLFPFPFFLFLYLYLWRWICHFLVLVTHRPLTLFPSHTHKQPHTLSCHAILAPSSFSLSLLPPSLFPSLSLSLSPSLPLYLSLFLSLSFSLSAGEWASNFLSPTPFEELSPLWQTLVSYYCGAGLVTCCSCFSCCCGCPVLLRSGVELFMEQVDDRVRGRGREERSPSTKSMSAFPLHTRVPGPPRAS
jgi:hypothetical protein